jgi:PAS domain S-box-containing protein
MTSDDRSPGFAVSPHEASAPNSAASAGVIDDRSFRAVADCTFDWESWHDPNGGLVWVNPTVERMTGYSVAECLVMRDYPLPLVAIEDRPRFAEMMARARAGSSGGGVEFRIVYRGGELKWMDVSWQPMYEGGRHLGFRTSVRDITDRRRLRDELRLHNEHLEQLVQERAAKIQQLERQRREVEKLAALGQLAAGVAHEINNPLAGIRNAFELIKGDLGPEHEHYEILELIDREIERISSIIYQMYQLYRRPQRSAIEFDLQKLVGEVIWLLDGPARKRDVALRIRPAADLPKAYLPEGEVKQVLYNLMRNAIQASPRGAIVDVGVAQAADEVHVTVRDSGPGIEAEVLPHIFEPFFSTKSEEAMAGMGLGLSVSRSLIEAMDGRIEVDSTPGSGSQFTAVFPWRLPSVQQEPLPKGSQ